MLVANKWLPIIGVPVKHSDNDGSDSLSTILQCLYPSVKHVSVTISTFRHVCQPDMSIDHTQKGRPVATISFHGYVLTISRCA